MHDHKEEYTRQQKYTRVYTRIASYPIPCKGVGPERAWREAGTILYKLSLMDLVPHVNILIVEHVGVAHETLSLSG